MSLAVALIHEPRVLIASVQENRIHRKVNEAQDRKNMGADISVHIRHIETDLRESGC